MDRIGQVRLGMRDLFSQRFPGSIKALLLTAQGHCQKNICIEALLGSDSLVFFRSIWVVHCTDDA